MSDIPDVDLEVCNREFVRDLFPEAHTASQKIDNHLTPHGQGIYFQDIPLTPEGMAAIPYKDAEAHGFYKVDLLAAPYPYLGLDSMDELRDWLSRPIDWDWFEDVEFVRQLFQLGGPVYVHGQALSSAEVVAYYKPRSIPDLAIMIAILRPAKKYLIGQTWVVIREHIWLPEPPEAGARFKKSHAIAYALAVGLDARRRRHV